MYDRYMCMIIDKQMCSRDSLRIPCRRRYGAANLPVAHLLIQINNDIEVSQSSLEYHNIKEGAFAILACVGVNDLLILIGSIYLGCLAVSNASCPVRSNIYWNDAINAFPVEYTLFRHG